MIPADESPTSIDAIDAARLGTDWDWPFLSAVGFYLPFGWDVTFWSWQSLTRDALIGLGVMLKSGVTRTVSEGMEKLTSVRPGIRLTAVQRRCIETVAAQIDA